MQSIGQSSVVTGTQKAGGYIMRQGFLQPSSRAMGRSIENNVAIVKRKFYVFVSFFYVI